MIEPLLSQVRGAVMATLAAVQLEDLPVVVKFILHSASSFDAYEVRGKKLKAVIVFWLF